MEQLAPWRAIPGLITLRPADASEIVEAWQVIMQLRHQPVALVLSRQPLPTLDRSVYAPASGVARGAYVLADAPDGKPDVLLLASGSEVSLRVKAYVQLGVVKAAQARGDFAVLAERGRRALRVHLDKDVAAGLATLRGAIAQALA